VIAVLLGVPRLTNVEVLSEVDGEGTNALVVDDAPVISTNNSTEGDDWIFMVRKSVECIRKCQG
jgi:hypothetical protein